MVAESNKKRKHATRARDANGKFVKQTPKAHARKPAGGASVTHEADQPIAENGRENRHETEPTLKRKTAHAITTPRNLVELAMSIPSFRRQVIRRLVDRLG